jgi:4-aminobutyrate aminotransferase
LSPKEIVNGRHVGKRDIPGKKSEQIIQISRAYEPPGMADQVPIVWDHGEGVWVRDVDDNKHIDFTSGVQVTNIGHSHCSPIGYN